MEVTRIRALRGPNLWSRRTAIEAVVTCESAERDLRTTPEFEKRLREMFPSVGGLHANKPSTPISMAHALELTALALQAEAGCPVTFSRTTPTEIEGTFQVAVQYTEEAVGRLAFEKAQQLCRAAAEGGSFDLAATLAELRELDEDERLGPSTGAIVDAAIARGIPIKRLTRGSLVQLGWGSQQRRIQAAEVDDTSAIAESIAQDKDLTKKLLHSAGVPVPLGRPVADVEDAWTAAQEIGLPVVVKPQDGNQGKGVTVGITERSHFDVAYKAAAEYGGVMVEKFLPGHDFRLLVVGDRLVAAARRDPPLVIGDGQHTVRELVAEVNKDPRRGDGHGTSLTKIRIDAIAEARLQAQELTPDSVPASGQRVVLRNNANLSTGGSATDVTDSVHPEVAARAVEAAQMVGLDICGVDVVCETVIKPLEEQNGGIVEVNAAPGLRMHISPSFGKGRDVGAAVMDHMYPQGGNGRVPVIAVTGTNGKTTTVRLTAHLLKAQGLRVGMTNTDGGYVNGRQSDSGDCSGPRSARNGLAHPAVDAAVLETARGGLLREGLAFDQCDVAIVTNLGGGDHLGLHYITTLEDLKVLKRVIVLNVAPTGTAVLNAADPAVAAIGVHVVDHRLAHVATLAERGADVHAQAGRGVDLDNAAVLLFQRLDDGLAHHVDAADVQAHRLRGFDGARGHFGVHAVGHVGGGAAGREVGVVAQDDALAGDRHRIRREVLRRQARLGDGVDADLGERGAVALAAARVLVDLGHQLAHGVLAVADDQRRIAPGGGHQLVAHHQQAEVVAGQVALDHHGAVACGLGVGDVEMGAVDDADGDALALVAVLRLHHHGQADVLRGGPGVFQVGDRATQRHRHAGRVQQLLGQVLVLGDGFGDGAGAIHLGGLDAALLTAPAELHQAAPRQALDGDAALQGGVDDGAGGRAQALVLVQLVQLGQHGGDVERLACGGGATQRLRLLEGQAAHGFLGVLHGDLEGAFDLGGGGAAEGDGAAGLRLQRQRGQLQRVRHRDRRAGLVGVQRAHLGKQLAQALLEFRGGVQVALGRVAGDDGFDRRVAAPQVGAAQRANAGDFHGMS